MREQGFVGQLTSLRFVVRADGVPIELTFNGEVIVPGARVTLGSTLYASRVGEPITIEKPVP
jgi:hypothetical protein